MDLADLEGLVDETPVAEAPVAVNADGTEPDPVEALIEANSDAKARGDKIKAARVAKMEKLFAGQKYEVLKPFDLTGRTFDVPEGDKDFGKPLKLETSLGNKIRKGFVIRLLPEFTPRDGCAAVQLFGWSVLEEAANTYGALELPAVTTKGAGRPRKSAADKVKAEAERVALRQASHEALLNELGIPTV